MPAGEADSPHQYLFTEQMLPDTMNAALLFTLLVTILKCTFYFFMEGRREKGLTFCND
jgi:hypothetical protein